MSARSNRLRETLISLGCATQIVFLTNTPLPQIAAIGLPLAALAAGLGAGSESKLPVRLLATALYLAGLVTCLYQAGSGARPAGGTVLVLLMLPGAFRLLYDVFQAIRAGRASEHELP